MNIVGIVADSLNDHNVPNLGTSNIATLGYRVLVKDGDKISISIFSDKEIFNEPVVSILKSSMPVSIITKLGVIVTDDGVKEVERKFFALNNETVLPLNEDTFKRIEATKPPGSIIINSKDNLKVDSRIVDRLRNENAEYYNLVPKVENIVNVNPSLVNTTIEQESQRVNISQGLTQEPTQTQMPLNQAGVVQQKVEIKAPVVAKEEVKPTVLPAGVTEQQTYSDGRKASSINPSITLPAPDKNGLYYGKTEEEYVYNSLLVRFLNSAIMDYDYGVNYADNSSEENFVSDTAAIEVSQLQAKLNNLKFEVNIAKKTKSCKELYLYIMECYEKAQPIHINGKVINPVTGAYVAPGTQIVQDNPKETRVEVPKAVPVPQETSNTNIGGAMTESKVLKLVKVKNQIIGYLIYIKGTIINNNKKVPLDSTTFLSQKSLYKTLKGIPLFTKFTNAEIEYDNDNAKVVLQFTPEQLNTLSTIPNNRSITTLDMFDVVTLDSGVELKYKYFSLAAADVNVAKQLALIELNESENKANEQVPQVAPQVAVPVTPQVAVEEPKVEPITTVTEQEASTEVQSEELCETSRFIGTFEKDQIIHVVYTNSFNNFKAVPTSIFKNLNHPNISVTPNRIFVEFADGSIKALQIK